MFRQLTLRRVRAEQRVLRSHVGQLVPDEVPLLEAPAMWQAFDGIERLASSAKTLLARRVDESGVWQRQGYRSAAEYLAAKSGTSVGAARQGLDSSKKLQRLPRTEAAVRRGELSRPQADAIADAAAANPDAERRLLGAAQRANLRELRDECQRAKAAADRDVDARYQRIRAERRLRQWTDAEGAWNAMVRGTPDAGARFNAALQPIIEELFAVARREGRHEPREAYAHDALIELARRAHDHPDDPGEDTGDDDLGRVDPVPVTADLTDTAPGTDTDDTRRTRPAVLAGAADAPVGANRRARRRATKAQSRRRATPRYQALLRLDYQALVRGHIQGDELCEITGLGPIPVPVARQLLGDAVLKLVITKGVDVAHVTHLGRGPNAAQHIALLWRSPICIVEGCSDVRVERDHRVPYADCHETRLDNIDPKCRWHHYLKTHKGWALVPGVGKRPMVPPEDPRHPNNSPPVDASKPPPGGDAPPETCDGPGNEARKTYDGCLDPLVGNDPHSHSGGATDTPAGETPDPPVGDPDRSRIEFATSQPAASPIAEPVDSTASAARDDGSDTTKSNDPRPDATLFDDAA